jgi:hypothetical protein
MSSRVVGTPLARDARNGCLVGGLLRPAARTSRPPYHVSQWTSSSSGRRRRRTLRGAAVRTGSM